MRDHIEIPISRTVMQRLVVQLTPAQWEAERERVARAVALTDNEDGCFEELDAWNALEQWERDAYPDEEPDWSRESRDYHLKRAEAAMNTLGFRRLDQ